MGIEKSINPVILLLRSAGFYLIIIKFIMIQLSNLSSEIFAFISYQNYLPLWIAAVIVLIILISLNFWKPVWSKHYRIWLMLVAGLIILSAIIFWAPKVKFYYDTRLDLPSHLSEQEKQQYIDRWNEIMNSGNHGKNGSGLYNDIGITKSSYKDYEGAVKSFKLAIEKNPGDARFYRNLGITYVYMDKYQEAESAFREAFKLAPTQPEYWLELGELYSFKIKDQKKARLFYLEALSRSGEHLKVIQAFAIFLENVEKDYPEAIKYWQMLADRIEIDKPAFLIHIDELKARIGYESQETKEELK